MSSSSSEEAAGDAENPGGRAAQMLRRVRSAFHRRDSAAPTRRAVPEEEPRSETSDDESPKMDHQTPAERTRARRERLRRAQESIKGRHIHVKDLRDLLLYLRCDVQDGTGPHSLNRELPAGTEILEDDDVDEEEKPDDVPVFYQSAKTGAWIRQRAPKQKRKRRRVADPVLAALDAEVEAADGVEEDRSKHMERCINAFFMAVQGALAGFAAAIALIEYALDENARLVEHYGQVSNLFRRWAYILSSMALVGALNKFQVAHQDRNNWKTLEPLARIEMRTLAVFYLGAFALTLVCASVDVSLSTDFDDDDNPWHAKFSPAGVMSLGTWRKAIWLRFFLATLGWLLSCRRHDRVVRDRDRAALQLDKLRAAISAASDKAAKGAK
ncbi:hypothetical protein CTAYLR_002799 [Chrysophaeum taylorii]|uniref:Uncharacterized protein n=1 Tax=Chrysophaeum taylorii TaxID=2483200 RepID=A0AAD7UAA1_9STRA|nr:hypothetical protein CTAYLR_002799 [Chrysophaeum taylorii]